MSAVTLAASATMLIGSNVHVGEEVSTSARSVIVNAGTGATTTTQTGVVLTADIWSVGNVSLATGTQLTGGVTTAGTLTQQQGVTVAGPITQHATLAPVSTTLTIAFPASSTDAVLQPGQSATRSPGVFANVTVNSRATLTLTSGTYYIDSLDIEPQGTVAFSGAGPFIINIRSNFVSKGQFTLPAVSPTPTFVVVDAGSADATLQSQFDGTLIAPNANVILVGIGTAVYHGAFFGKSITLQAGVNVLHRGASAGSVTPIAECVIAQPDGSYKAVFGYNASNLLGNQTVPIGPNNTFLPAPANRGQPTVFLPGRQRAQFLVPFDGRGLTWTLDGVSTTATAAAPACTAACVQHLVDTTKPRVTAPLSTAAPVLSVDESKVMRDSFRWQDTLPVPETFSDGTPRLYHGLVFVDSPETVQTLDFLRIDYRNTPYFEQEIAALETLGVHELFSHPFDGSGQFVYALIPGAVFNALRQQALDPTQPSEIFRALPFRPIPSSDLGYAPRSTCGLQPITECVAQASNGSLRAVFSYNNQAGNPVTIPVSTDNVIAGGPANALPPEAFAAGQHVAVFAVPISSGATVRWTLNGQAVSASASTARCSAATIAKIGVDIFNPFPASPTPSCRFATPAEAAFPSSKLPPAARANTCLSTSYNYLGTLGFKWRGVDSDVDDTAGQAADAAFALGASSGSAAATMTVESAGSGVEIVQSALFGKLFRKAVQAVGNVAHGAVDGLRRGLRVVAGLFLGTTDAQVTIDPQLTDASFTPGTMKQAWGAGFGKPISLKGVEIRANLSAFLSVANLDANNHAQLKVLSHAGAARICFRMTSDAGFVTNSWTAIEVCPDPNLRVSSSNPNVTLQTTSEYLNVMAQITDARGYMTNVAKFNPSRAEVVIGYAPSLIGLVNGNRAFTPCLSFSWKNDVEVYVELLAAQAGTAAFSYTDKYVQSESKRILTAAANGLTTLIDQQAALATLQVQLAGTGLKASVDMAKAAVDDAVVKLVAARTAATVLTQEADDFAKAVGTAARLTTANDAAVRAAQSVAQQTLDNVNAQVAITTTAMQNAAQAATAASALVASLAIQAAGTTAAAAIGLVRDGLDAVLGHVGTVGSIALGKIGATVSAAVAAGVIQVIGGAIAEVFEFLAGGDMLLPSTKNDQSNLIDRGIVTHEYGHFTLCNLLDQTAPVAFGVAYDEAALQGVLSKQAPSATGAVLNESFADLIASQVVGGTNYAAPPTNYVQSSWLRYCLADGTGCIEDNFTNALATPSFNDEVLRDVTLYTDAFDSPWLRSPISSDRPMNGNEWQPGIQLAGSPGAEAGDEVVGIDGTAFRDWISHAMKRGTLLREDNVFAGLSDAMIDQRYNWCARCQVFRLHTVDLNGTPICPTAWVGARPTFDANGTTGTLTCAFEGCPTGTKANSGNQICDPCPTGQHLDENLLTCADDIVIP